MASEVITHIYSTIAWGFYLFVFSLPPLSFKIGGRTVIIVKEGWSTMVSKISETIKQTEISDTSTLSPCTPVQSSESWCLHLHHAFAPVQCCKQVTRALVWSSETCRKEPKNWIQVLAERWHDANFLYELSRAYTERCTALVLNTSAGYLPKKWQIRVISVAATRCRSLSRRVYCP